MTRPAPSIFNRDRRWSRNQKSWGIFTFAKSEEWKPIALHVTSGDEESPGTHLLASWGGRTLIVELPHFLKPWVNPKERWDSGARTYGFRYSRDRDNDGDVGFLQVFLGPQTNSSATTRSWSKFIPWHDWRFHAQVFYGEKGEPVEVFDRGSLRGDTQKLIDEHVPLIRFTAIDHDGTRVPGTARIRTRVWLKGTGWFKWLSWFTPPLVRHSMELDFESETGPEKGSWKGGLMGTGVEIDPYFIEESILFWRVAHMHGLRKFFDQEQRSKHGPWRFQGFEWDGKVHYATPAASEASPAAAPSAQEGVAQGVSAL